jgi:hypothetical protein
VFSHTLFLNRCTLQILKGAASGLSVYACSPGQSKKKRPSVSICPIACAAGSDILAQCAMTWAIICKGRGLTLVGGGSCLE